MSKFKFDISSLLERCLAAVFFGMAQISLTPRGVRFPQRHLTGDLGLGRRVVEGHQTYQGALPKGIQAPDTAASLASRWGPPKNEIVNKKTGQVSSHRWPLETIGLLNARYRPSDGTVTIVHLDLY